MSLMRQRFRLYRRQGKVFYLFDNDTGKQESLRTTNRKHAERLLHARNEAHQQPLLNL